MWQCKTHTNGCLVCCSMWLLQKQNTRIKDFKLATHHTHCMLRCPRRQTTTVTYAKWLTTPSGKDWIHFSLAAHSGFLLCDSTEVWMMLMGGLHTHPSAVHPITHACDSNPEMICDVISMNASARMLSPTHNCNWLISHRSPIVHSQQHLQS